MGKRIYIYGAGRRGIQLYEAIKADYNEMIIVEGFIDQKVKGMVRGINVYDISKISADSTIVISIYDFETALNAAYELKKRGYTDIYWFNIRNHRKNRCDFWIELCVSCKDWHEDTLSHVEIHAMDACNLNCTGCTHFAPIFENIKPNTEKRLNDIKLLSKRISGVVNFFIMGGEPLLNDEIDKYILGVKEAFPNANIIVVTNGLLIPKCSESLLRFFSENNVCISISEYMPTHSMITKITSVLDDYNIIYNIRPYDSKQMFNKPLSLEKKNERFCLSKDCINLLDGRVACCPTLLYLPVLNKKFGLHLPEEGIIDLNTGISGKELKDKLYESVPLCDHCIRNEIEWSVCGKNPDVTDFVEI